MSIKFVRDGKEQQQWALPEDNYREESNLYSSINEHQTLHKDSWESKIHLRNNTIPLSLSMCSSLFLFFSLSPSLSSPFPNALSFHYIALLHHILTIHFNLTPFLFRHLHLKKVMAGTCLAVAYTVQVTSSLMRLIKLLSSN